MSIIRMCDKDTPGAYKSEYWSTETNHDIYLHETHKGLVLETREYNGYHDSDFYAIVWDEEEGRTARVDYATTRGWSYPNNATVDATDEVREKYNAWLAYERRKSHVRHKLGDRRKRRADARDTGLTVKQINRLEYRLGLGTDHYEAVIKLLRTRHHDRFRSEFRRNLAEQAYNWLLDDEPKYASPFSRKQWMYI